jgi:hypothetical protein
MTQSPEIHVHIVPSNQEPSGVGELCVILIGPAVAKAIFAATGVRVRRLPVDRELLARRRGISMPHHTVYADSSTGTAWVPTGTMQRTTPSSTNAMAYRPLT